MSREQVIYLMERDNGDVKIGISGIPKFRKKMLETELKTGISLTLMWSVDGSAKDVERGAHDILRDRRVSGEWFNIEVRDAIDAVTQTAEELGLTLVPVDSFSMTLWKQQMVREGRELPEAPPPKERTER